MASSSARQHGHVRLQLKRLKRAEQLLQAAWDALEPEDIKDDKWGELQRLILHLRAKQKRFTTHHRK